MNPFKQEPFTAVVEGFGRRRLQLEKIMDHQDRRALQLGKFANHEDRSSAGDALQRQQWELSRILGLLGSTGCVEKHERSQDVRRKDVESGEWFLRKGEYRQWVGGSSGLLSACGKRESLDVRSGSPTHNVRSSWSGENNSDVSSGMTSL